MARRAALEKRLGHRFSAPRLLDQALTHRGYSADNNERLEFLGDGVLGCAVREALCAQFPGASEGELTRLAASLVRAETLANLAAKLQLDKDLKLAETPRGGGLEDGPSESMMADAMEAVFGAVFLDAGYDAAKKVILRVYGRIFETLDPRYLGKDPKSELQELLQARYRRTPQYRLIGQRRGPRDNVFEVECLVEPLKAVTTGSGSSRQRAEQEAAKAMLQQLAR